MVYHREAVRRFFVRTTLVNTLAILCTALIVPTAYFALSSPLFNQFSVAARTLFYTLHRDVFSLAVIFLVLAAIHSAGFIGRGLRGMLSWKALYPIAQLSYSLYLVHEMVMLWLFPKTAQLLGSTLGAPATMTVAGVIALVLSFALAAVLYLLIRRSDGVEVWAGRWPRPC